MAALAAALAFGLASAAAAVPVDAPAGPDDLKDLSIEQLADVRVTSVSKRPEALLDAPAAIYVISAEDIRRAGVNSLPEALRLAPNLEVARVNASEYAISARGFNSLEASNKLLVLVDGRSVYSPVGSQVYWDQVNVMLADVDRIEVISGPGGTLYGVNAVNGVINIITKPTSDTQGPLITAGGGDFERDGSVRLGGKLGDNASFRAYVTSFDRDNLPKFVGDTTNDAYRGTQAGFRVDSTASANGYTVQGDIYHDNIAGGGVNSVTELNGGNLLGRWTRQFGSGASGMVQVYYDQTDRRGAGQEDLLQTYDVQAQHTFLIGDRQTVVWGAELRVWNENFQTNASFLFPDPRATLTLGDVFVQDEIAIRPDLKATLGIKFEDNTFSGADWLPNARLAWTPDDHDLIWASVSRAVRTPNRIERQLELPGILAPSPDFASEELWAYEIGYRSQPTPRATLSISTFFNDYDGLRVDDLTNLGLPIQLRNGAHGNTYGVEAWGEYSMTSWWRLKGGMNLLHRDFQLKPGHVDITQLQAAGYDPAYQFQIHSAMNLSPNLELDAAVRRVDAVKGVIVGKLAPAYTEADARLAWRFSRSTELSLDGYNLLNPHHLEINDSGTSPMRTIPRSVFLSLRWGF